MSYTKLARHSLSLVVVMGLLILAVGSYDDGGSKKIGAYVMSQEFVNRRLKAPATASYPDYRDDFVVDMGNNRYRVTAYVDAENSFGAKLRMGYTCTLMTPDGENWKCENINIEEN